MKKAFVLSLAIVTGGMAVPAAAYYWSKPSSDPLDDALRAYDFRRINPPNNLMTVGSLYYVDSAGKSFTSLCEAEKSDLDGQVIVSPTWEMRERIERNGRFSTGVTLDLRALLKGEMESGYIQTVHASLTDVVLEEIPLGPNWLIFSKLMQKPECNKLANDLVNAGGYVCQGQKTLKATAEFRLGRDVQNKLETEAKLTPEAIRHVVKHAVESQAHETVVEREDRLLAGAALKYGVVMNPTCYSPASGRFRRILPRTTFDRVVNFVLFRVVEPMFPAEPAQVAQQGEVTKVAGL
ncbi:MAG TPA: hypothetical protein VH678_23035 [Xanthobacteraceae bacterium]